MLDPILSRWLDVQAQALDVGSCDPQEVLPRLAEANILKIGVPTQLGGLGGDVAGAVEAIANVASHSLAAAFVAGGVLAPPLPFLSGRARGLTVSPSAIFWPLISVSFVAVRRM